MKMDAHQPAVIVVFKSPNGREPWTPVDPLLVPAYVKRPEIMGRLIAGEQCMDVAEGAQGGDWYRANRATVRN